MVRVQMRLRPFHDMEWPSRQLIYVIARDKRVPYISRRGLELDSKAA
jgi:hypothetical protein